jgi:hypothetical protein
MKHMRRLSFALAALVYSSLAAHGQEITGTMGDTTFNLAVPSGYCVSDPRNPADAQFVNYLAKLLENAKNKLIRTVIDCRELRARRADASKPIYDYLNYYFPAASENTKLSGDTQENRKTLCDELRQQSDATLEDVPQIVEKTAREMKMTGGINSTKYLGVLAADPHGCYAGLLVGVRDGKGNVTLIYTIVVRTAIHGKDLWMASYSRYGTNADSAHALQLAQTTAADLDAKNPE